MFSPPIQDYLVSLHARLSSLDKGDVASYIPELSKASPAWFGISMVTMDGTVYAVGDTEQRFTIQSISKPFIYASALTERGQAYVSRKVGVEPSGEAFNSISLNPQTGAPLNPMINAGAIASTSLIPADTPEAQWDNISEHIGAFMGREISIDEAVYRSESDTGFRNRAIAWMLKNFGIIDGDPMSPLENYFRQCSILVDCRDLAFMAATLANDGVHPVTGKRALASEHVTGVLSVMATCGMYDYAGSWLYEVGMPAKSGVGGGIIAVLPGRFGIGIFSPPLDAKGNSVRGIEVCKQMSKDLGLNVFTHAGNPSMALGRIYTGADVPSRRQPGPSLRSRLKQQAHRIKYLCLHGFLAVDGMEYIVRKMRDLAPDTHSFIIDMHEVTGISSSAAKLLNQARIKLREDDIAVVLSRIQGRRKIMDALSKQVDRDDRGFLIFEDNDLAVEWCENRLYGLEQMQTEATHSLSDFPLFAGLSDSILAKIKSNLRLQNYAPGEQILFSGQEDDGRLFFIEYGQISILVPLKNGSHQRVSSLGPGMNFGEMVLLGQTTRSASVHADNDAKCWILDMAKFEQISLEHPEMKLVMLENVARDLADKLRRATTWISALA
jgi:glutaminase